MTEGRGLPWRARASPRRASPREADRDLERRAVAAVGARRPRRSMAARERRACLGRRRCGPDAALARRRDARLATRPCRAAGPVIVRRCRRRRRSARPSRRPRLAEHRGRRRIAGAAGTPAPPFEPTRSGAPPPCGAPPSASAPWLRARSRAASPDVRSRRRCRARSALPAALPSARDAEHAAARSPPAPPRASADARVRRRLAPRPSPPVALARAPAPLRSARACTRDFPILEERVHGKPPGLARQRGDDAEAARRDRSDLVLLRARELEHPPRRAHARGARDRRLRGRAREGAALPQRAVAEGDRLRPRRDRGHQPGRAELGPAQRRRRRRDRHHLARAPREHRPVAACSAPRRARSLRVAPVDDRGRGHPRGVREAARSAHAARRRSRRCRTRSARSRRRSEMVEIAHRHGARVLVDGAQAVSHMPVDVQALDCDFYVFSGHKVFAPDRHRRGLRQSGRCSRRCRRGRAAAT